MFNYSNLPLLRGVCKTIPAPPFPIHLHKSFHQGQHSWLQLMFICCTTAVKPGLFTTSLHHWIVSTACGIRKKKKKKLRSYFQFIVFYLNGWIVCESWQWKVWQYDIEQYKKHKHFYCLQTWIKFSTAQKQYKNSNLHFEIALAKCVSKLILETTSISFWLQ